MEYVSRVPRPPLDGLVDDLYYLEGASPYARLTLPPVPGAFLIVNLGAPFRIRAGTDIETSEYADGCVIPTPTRALEFSYPLRTRTVGVHFKPWGLAPFLPMPAVELCDRPVTVEQVWGRPSVAELRDRLARADGPHEKLTLLEEELMRRLCETAGLGLVRPLWPRVPGVHRDHAEPVRRSPAAIPARTSRQRAGQLAAASRLISYKTDSPGHANMGASKAEETPVGKVIMYASVSVDGFIADENDLPGPLFDWLVSGDVPLDESGALKVSQTSYDYTRPYWDQIGATIVAATSST